MFPYLRIKLKGLTYLLENPVTLNVKRAGGTVKDFLYLNKLWLHNHKIDTVIDIGANIGQFAATIHYVFPEASIYSFEPLPECCAILKKKMRKISRFQLFPIALGDQNCTVDFNYNVSSAMSSVLQLNSDFSNHFSFDTSEKKVQAIQKRLDDIADELKLGNNILIKMDVQGYEDKVIKGAGVTLKKSKILIIETSFEQIYKGQCMFDDIYSELKKLGFAYIGSMDTMFSPKDGRPIQEDSIFLNKSLANNEIS